MKNVRFITIVDDENTDEPEKPVKSVSAGRTLHRKCACGQYTTAGKCVACKKKLTGGILNRTRSQAEVYGDGQTAHFSIHKVLRSPSNHLVSEPHSLMESRFDHDFSKVRVHTGPKAAELEREVNALAYTVGHNIDFGEGECLPETTSGKRLLAHELSHTIYQGLPSPYIGSAISKSSDQAQEKQAERVAQLITDGFVTYISTGQVGTTLHLQRRGRSVSVRSPVFEQTVTQISDIAHGVAGRALTSDERNLARPIFGSSIDYSRVRLIPLSILEYRIVGNNIYTPDDFTIRNPYMTQTLIHELTHIWQYQHSGTSYISESLMVQIGATISRGARNFAYNYQIGANQTFFDFSPEEQGLLVENYFSMLHDQATLATDQAASIRWMYNSNHFGPDGFPARLTTSQRQAEISRALQLHEPLTRQMQASMPRSELNLLKLRASEVMRIPGAEYLSIPVETQIALVRPLFEVRY
jgi:hypothetical protein